MTHSKDLLVIHQLKTWPGHFSAVVSGLKTFEVRRNDRKFAVGDLLLLREFDHGHAKYTGRMALVTIEFILTGDERLGIDDDFCVMSIRGVGTSDERH